MRTLRTSRAAERDIEQRVRIIGGRWRGRTVRFDSRAALRPTPNRVRETLFNWLRDAVPDSHCLDLFAGSGALGLEALSRGAASCVFIESCEASAVSIRRHLQTFSDNPETLARSQVVVTDALHWLRCAHPLPRPFDVVFLDPPFAEGLLVRCASMLDENGWLRPDSYIYMECSSGDELPRVPARWKLAKSKTAGEVSYHLARVGLHEN